MKTKNTAADVSGESDDNIRRRNWISEMLGRLQEWKGHSVNVLAQFLGVTTDDLRNWTLGTVPPANGKFRLLEELYHEASSVRTIALLTALGQWGYTETQIARHLDVGESAVCRWLSGETAPSREHLGALEAFHGDAHQKLFNDWLKAHRFAFLCSQAGSRPVGHELHAIESLALSLQSRPPKGADNIGFPFILDVRFEDLPSHVRGHAYISRREHRPIFVVILNRNDDPLEQERTFFVELDAHVLGQFRARGAAPSQPKRILRANRSAKKSKQN